MDNLNTPEGNVNEANTTTRNLRKEKDCRYEELFHISNQCDDCSKVQDGLFESGNGSQIICDHVTINQLFPDSILGEDDRLWKLQYARQTMDKIEKLPSQKCLFTGKENEYVNGEDRQPISAWIINGDEAYLIGIAASKAYMSDSQIGSPTIVHETIACKTIACKTIACKTIACKTIACKTIPCKTIPRETIARRQSCTGSSAPVFQCIPPGNIR